MTRSSPVVTSPESPSAGDPAQPLLRLEGVSRDFVTSGRGRRTERRVVLQGIDFTVEEGEFVSVIGPSGGGKTTLLNLLAGLLLPTEGTITLGTEQVTGPGADRGVVFQQDAIFPWRTVRRNVEYGLERAGVRGRELHERAQVFIDLVGLTEFADYLPKQLSGGMKKRVAIAAVLANGPAVLLMDEPFGALDYSTRVRLQDELLRIWQERRVTTVFVTHDLEEALYLSDRILVLADGTLAEDYRVRLPRPRTEMTRMSPELQQAKAHLWGYL
ncbi:MAG: ABC transporter ATP-binding protein [Pseudonocardia sp.]